MLRTKKSTFRSLSWLKGMSWHDGVISWVRIKKTLVDNAEDVGMRAVLPRSWYSFELRHGKMIPSPSMGNIQPERL